MARHLIICTGSRGDVEPFAALSTALQVRTRTRPIVCAPKDYAHLMPSCCDTYALPFATVDLRRCFEMPPPPGTPPHLTMWAGLGHAINEVLLPETSTLLDIARRSGGLGSVVASYLMRPLGLILADRYGIPLTVVQLQPQVPTAYFPHHAQPHLTAAAIVAQGPPKDNYLRTYVELEGLLFDIFSERMNAFREELGLPRLSFPDVLLLSKGNNPSVHVANAFPLALVPDVPADYGSMVYHCGPLADSYARLDKLGDEVAAEDAVRAFLAAGDPPVCVGLGSMSASPVVCLKIITSLRDAGVERVIFVGGVSSLGADPLPLEYSGDENLGKLREWAVAHTISVKFISYTWLLPQCSVMLCHGGAGVVSATLRAGIPSIVVPVLFDQFVWGRLVEERGFGILVGPSIEEASSTALVDAVKRAMSSELLRMTCTSLGERLRNERAGVDRLVDSLVELSAPTQ